MFRIVSGLHAVARRGAALTMADAPPSGNDQQNEPDLEAELWSQSDFYHQELQRLARQLEELREAAAERDHALTREAELKGRLRKRDDRLQRLQDHRDEALQRIEALESDLRSATVSLQDANAALDELRPQRDQLEKLLEQERESSRRVASQRDKSMKKAKRLNKKLDALENSLSWRLTRPLRRLRAHFRPKH